MLKGIEMNSNNGTRRTNVSDATGESKLVLLLMPPVLVVTMFIIFQILTNSRGFHTGYLLSFVIYWVAWGTIFPILILGTPRGLPDLFLQPRNRRFSKSATNSKNWLIIQVLIWLPIVFPLIFSFFPRIAHLEPPVIIVSIIIGGVIGVTEEILWRGVYIRKFPSSKFFGIIYPAIWFSVWHIAPQSVLPNQMPGGIASFLFYALLLGLD